MSEDLNALVRERTRFKGDLSRIVDLACSTVDLFSVPLLKSDLISPFAMSVQLSVELNRKLLNAALTRGVSVNNLIRSALAKYLEDD